MYDMQDITQQTFKQTVIDHTGIAMVLVREALCPSCKEVIPVLEQLEKDFVDHKIECYSLNLDDDPGFRAYYKLPDLPALLVFEHGSLITSFAADTQMDDLRAYIQQRLFPVEPETSTDATSPIVTVFSTPTCPYCTMIKSYLDEKGVVYTEHDVSVDREKAMQMVQKSGQMGVPQVWIDDAVVVGFDKPKINTLLNLT